MTSATPQHPLASGHTAPGALSSQKAPTTSPACDIPSGGLFTNKMNILSLFDGMSCGRIAADRRGLNYGTYYASEIDKYAIKVANANYPDTVQLGNIDGWKDWDIDWSKIGLLIGGSPCQGFSLAGKQLAFDDPRSRLFFVFVDILNHIREVNPNVKFMLENVKMKHEWMDVITEYIGVKPIRINSNMFSAQNRDRFYWSNWTIPDVIDRGIFLSEILEDLPDCKVGVSVRDKSKCIRVGGRSSPFGGKHEWDSPYQRISKNGKVKPGILKAGCLTGGANSGGNHSDMDIVHSPIAMRRYSLIECERLQTVPDGYTNHVSASQRYKMLGNGWTVDVISHIFEGMSL